MHAASPADGGTAAKLPRQLSVSIVTYGPDRAKLESTLASLDEALAAATLQESRVFVIHNGPGEPPPWLQSAASRYQAELVSGHGNPGFGRGHNLVLGEMGAYHLILNPDVDLAPDSLAEALAFMEGHPECGLLVPDAFWDDGSRQYLCKRYPSLFDLLLRGFFPARIRRLFAGRLARYEMRDLTDGSNLVWNPPLASGCFMLFRGELLARLGGFDPGYFLYFEDYDLSVRTRQVAQVAYVPAVKIVHHGGNAGRKGWRHIRLFARSASRFFAAYGWKWF